jgi:hypothetical protein
MALCGDIEIHSIMDTDNDSEILTVLDLARVFPPEFTKDNSKGYIFFRMLRPELVKNNNKALSSDALSSWQTDPYTAELDNDIENATNQLKINVEKFAQDLCDDHKMNYLYKHAYDLIEYPSYNSIPIKDIIIQELHIRGINLRYLGMIFMKMIENNKNISGEMTSSENKRNETLMDQDPSRDDIGKMKVKKEIKENKENEMIKFFFV